MAIRSTKIHDIVTKGILDKMLIGVGFTMKVLVTINALRCFYVVMITT